MKEHQNCDQKDEVKIVTCVYCGHEYPDGTPTSGAESLTKHIKICAKHPMKKMRDAIVDLIGTDGKEELEQIEAVMRIAPMAEKDRIAMLNLIHVLQETVPCA